MPDVETPELVKEVVTQSYADVIQAAIQHGFEEVYHLQRTADQHHYSLTLNGPMMTVTKPLDNRDLGLYSGRVIRLSQVEDLEKGDIREDLELLGGRNPIIIERGALLENQKDLMGVMQGIVPSIGPKEKGFYPGYYMRFRIAYRGQNDISRYGKIISLAEAVNFRESQPYGAEIAGTFGNAISVTAPGAELVPGMITPFIDHSWLVTRGGEALRAVIEDVFVMRERYYHLRSFGIPD